MWRRKQLVGLALSVAVLGTIGFLIYRHRVIPADRVYVVGWQSDPPSQIAGPNGQASGFAVDLVREAARRRGIRLQWSYHPDSSESALLNRHVDIWPIMTITEERRRKGIHFTEPYQEYEYGFLVRSDTPYFLAKQLSRARITHNGLPINDRLLGQNYPDANRVGSKNLVDAVQRMCRGEFDAVFGERFSTFSALLDTPICPGSSLRMLPVTSFSSEMAIASQQDSRVAANALRQGIEEMVEDGSVDEIGSISGHPYAQATVSLLALHQVQRRMMWYRVGITAVIVLFILAIAAAIAYRRARNRAEATGRALLSSERKVSLLASSLSEMVLAYDNERCLRYANPGAQKLTGYSLEELQSMELGSWVHPEDRAMVLAGWNSAYRGKKTDQITYRLLTKSGEQRWVSANWGPFIDQDGRQIGVQASERDISDRVRADEERAHLQQQLAKSQTLESIGRLAGGVAHDFNNLLTIIMGVASLLRDKTRGGPLEEPVKEILSASTHAADLTRQLLAFGRKQLIQPQVLDLNGIVNEASDMMRRLIGEDVSLQTNLDPSPFPILADPGQLNQVLLNLAANARDAITGIGSLLIETRNVTLDNEYAANHISVVPGEYLQLTVTDSGVGMDEVTLNHIFEPFFTTKTTGRGTGLGLATVYGIVKQAGGYIWAYSEPGTGTSFKLYFPRVQARCASEPIKETVAPRSASTETILIVEDQAQLRPVIAQMLRNAGYRVLDAGSGKEAMEIAQQPQNSIALVITDVVMTDMNGRQLADRLSILRPEIRVLFMSGYTANVIAHRGVLDDDVNFISKPFTSSALVAKVREVLNQPAPPEAHAQEMGL